MKIIIEPPPSSGLLGNILSNARSDQHRSDTVGFHPVLDAVLLCCCVAVVVGFKTIPHDFPSSLLSSEKK